MCCSQWYVDTSEDRKEKRELDGGSPLRKATMRKLFFTSPSSSCASVVVPRDHVRHTRGERERERENRCQEIPLSLLLLLREKKNLPSCVVFGWALVRCKVRPKVSRVYVPLALTRIIPPLSHDPNSLSLSSLLLTTPRRTVVIIIALSPFYRVWPPHTCMHARD